MPGNFNISYLFNAIDKITPVAQKISKSFGTISKSVQKTTANLRTFGGTLTKTGEKISRFGRGAFLKLSAPIGLFIGMMIKSRAEMENIEIQFKTMLGSTEKATVLIDKIRTMAALTPFGEKDLFQNAKLLLNFGVSAEKIIPNLTMLGDIAGGNKDRFNRLSLAFAQVSAMGRLMGQDLLQMVNAGFNPLQIISEQTGRSMGDLKDIMSKGGISFEMVAKAMKIATSEGGKFYNLMEEGSKTTSGRFSTLMDTIRIELVALGKVLEPFTKAFIEKAIKLTEAFSKLSPETKKLILLLGIILTVLPVLAIGFGIITKAVGFMAFGVGGVITGVKGLAVALRFLALTPMGVLISSISFLITSLIILKENFHDVKEAAKFLLERGRYSDSPVEKFFGRDKIDDATNATSTVNTLNALGLNGTINIKGAPSGSTAEMSTSGNSSGNLGLNMSFAGGGI